MNIINSVPQVISSGIQLTDYLIALVEKHKAIKLSFNNCLRSCYLETLNNRGLLQAMDPEKLKTGEKWNEAFCAIIMSLKQTPPPHMKSYATCAFPCV